jgi:competence protein ComEA
MMMKKILAICAMLFAAASWAAVDVNKATEAELDSLKGVGPALSKRILDARGEGSFKDWPDLMNRVKGVKDKSAAKLSAEGLTVNGKSYGETAAVDKSAKAAPKKTAGADKPAKP